MNWELHLRNRAKKSLSRFPKKDQIYIAIGLRELVTNPYSGDFKTLTLLKEMDIIL